jgi:hypothetical protein
MNSLKQTIEKEEMLKRLKQTNEEETRIYWETFQTDKRQKPFKIEETQKRLKNNLTWRTLKNIAARVKTFRTEVNL